MEIEDLFDEHGALSFEKQLRLVELVGDEKRWRFNMDEGLLSFDTFQVSVQVLGTVSEYSKTWLWAWANHESNIPPALLSASERLRSFGQAEKVGELAEPQLHIEQFDSGHVIAMVAVGILGAAAYYRGPYEGGAVFLLIPELTFPPDDRSPNLQITSDFTAFISAYECDHKTAFESYVRQKGYSYRADGRRLRAEKAGQAPINASFDKQGRLTEVDAQISGPIAAASKPWWKFW